MVIGENTLPCMEVSVMWQQLLTVQHHHSARTIGQRNHAVDELLGMVDRGGQNIFLGNIQHLVHGVYQNTQLDTAHIQDDNQTVLLGGLAKAQTDILSNVSRYVKKGGALYYSTCSLFECENDHIVETFLKTHPDYEVENIESPLVNEKKKYGLQFLPDTAYGAGFYVCKMRRV